MLARFDPEAPPDLFDGLQLLLVASALVVDGVALAAIQALAEEDARLRQEAAAWQGRQRTEDRGRQERITRLEAENADLKAKTEELEARLEEMGRSLRMLEAR